MQVTSRRRVRASIIGTALLTATAGTVVGVASPAAAACADVEVVFARGTGEPAGLGSVGRPFVSALTSQLADRTVTSYAVDYAAASNQASAGPGATDMSRRISQTAAACPNTTFVIGGYSQGATVTSIAVGIRTGSTTGTPIPAALADRVSAVVVFGNPLGLQRGQTIATASPTYGPRSRDYCNSSDNVCGSQPSTGTGGHLSYNSNGSTTAGAQFAAGLVRSRTAPAPPTTPPTAPPTASCTEARPAQHVDAGRAVTVSGGVYARGSRDYLGRSISRTTVALQQDGPTSWSRVEAC